MNARLVTLFAVVAGLLPAPASAVDISVAPHAQHADVGDVVVIQLDYRLPYDTTVGGQYSVEYDPTALEVVAYWYGDLSDPQWQLEPTNVPGRLDDLTAGSFAGLAKLGRLVSVAFRVLREGTHVISGGPSSTYGDLWPSATTFGVFYEPNYVPGVIATSDQALPILKAPPSVESERIQPGGLTQMPIRISNRGTAPLSISRVELVENGDPLFDLVEQTCTDGTIAPGETCRVLIDFATASLPRDGIKTARLEVDSDDPWQPVSITSLTGHVASPRLTVSQLEFFDAHVGLPYSRYPVTLRNDGDWPARLDSVELGVTIPDNWFVLVADACTGRELGVGEECEVVLEVRSNVPERGFTFFRVRHDSGSFARLFELWAYTPTPVFELSVDGPREVNLNVGEVAFRRITIRNDGPGALGLPGRSGNFDENIVAIQDTCSDTLVPEGASCVIDLRIQYAEAFRDTHWVLFATNSLQLFPKASRFRIWVRDPQRTRVPGPSRH